MSVLIFANGDLPDLAWLTPYFESATAVIAADGGAHHVLQSGRVPDVVIGDLDSLDKDTLARLEQQGARIFRHPREKDETDLELALVYAAEQFRGEILIFGVLGGRLDQTLANILLLAHPGLVGKRVRLVEKYQRAWLITDQSEIEGAVGDSVSLIPLGGDAHVVETEGLKWQLRDEVLAFGPARGVSNVMTKVPATVKISDGQVLCIHTQRRWQR